MKEIIINTDKNKPGIGKVKHYWSNCVGAGRACEGLRADWRRQLREAREACGFRYIRFHGLLSDDMGVCIRENGSLCFHWQYIDSLFDFLLSIGIRPFVEFGFMPSALASGETTMFWWKGNVTPPSDYDAWGELITALVLHWKERYGLEEIRKWYYEIWNEPDLSVFWDGSRSEYFRLYESAVRAVKAIDPKLRVGGPATSNFVPDDRFAGEREDLSKHKTHLVEDLESLEWKGVWIQEFLEFAADRNLPVDFVSTHPYPTDFALGGQQRPDGGMAGRTRYVRALRDDIGWLKETIAKSPFPDVEIHLTEWSSSPCSRDYSHDFLPEASYIIRSNIENIGRVDSLSYWVFTDIFEEEGPGPQDFHGGFGLMNLQGIRKPSFHAYRMLHELGDEIVDQGEGYLITRRADQKLRILIWNYDMRKDRPVPMSMYPDYHTAEAFRDSGEEAYMNLEISHLEPGQAFGVEVLDKEHGCAAAAWGKLGYPANMNQEQMKVIKAASETRNYVVQAQENGSLKLNVKLGAYAVLAVREL